MLKMFLFAYREALQNTNEHLLGLLSDAVKTYMNIDDNISKKLKTMMEKPIDKSAETSGDRSGDKGRPRSAEGKRTPTRRSPQLSPSDRHSPVREDGAGRFGLMVLNIGTDTPEQILAPRF